MTRPRIWTPAQLEEDRQQALSVFRAERIAEPLELYLRHYQQAQDAVETLLEATVDLTQLQERGVDIFDDTGGMDVLRYLMGPPVSADDLTTLLTDYTLARTTFRNDSAAREALFSIILTGLDRERFPWVVPGREPTPEQRRAAVVATASLMANQRTQTERRSTSGKALEDAVRQMLRDLQMGELEPPRSMREGSSSLVAQVQGMRDFPPAGTFYGRETLLGDRKADVIAMTWSTLLVPMECKASSSELNSIKRLNNDAAAKAHYWLQRHGTQSTVPIAILSGVYKLQHLIAAQQAGLFIIWGHRLDDLGDWIASTRPAH